MTFTVDNMKAAMTKGGGLARSNLYVVNLPQLDPIRPPYPPTMNAYDMNIVCKSSQLPGRQVLSHERHIGHERSHIAYTYGVEDVTLTFRVFNDYKIKSYFDAWQSMAVNNQTYEIGYFKKYAKPVFIKQLRKGVSLPVYKADIGFLEDLPSNIRNRLPRLGPIDLAQGEIDLSLISNDVVMYEVELRNAFPTSITSIDLSDENQNGVVEISVQLSYTNWYDRKVDKSTGLAAVLAKFGIF